MAGWSSPDSGGFPGGCAFLHPPGAFALDPGGDSSPGEHGRFVDRQEEGLHVHELAIAHPLLDIGDHRFVLALEGGVDGGAYAFGDLRVPYLHVPAGGAAMTLSRVMASSNLARDLPKVLQQSAADTQLDIWPPALQMMVDREQRMPGEGFAALGAVTAQLLLMQMLRAYLACGGQRTVALGDTSRGHGIARVLRNLQRDPGRAWTMAGMARDAGMSRTTFAQHLGEVTGTTPFQHLAMCRMDYAAGLLENAKDSIADIAALAGYRSERAFRAAFARAYGVAPLAYRKRRVAKKRSGA